MHGALVYVAPFVLSFSFGAAAPASAADDQPCTLRSAGHFFDLTPLAARKDYELKTPGGLNLYINVCRSLTTEPWAIDGDTGGFVRRPHGDFSIGKPNSTLLKSFSDSHNLLMTFTKGSKCINSDYQASSVIEFVCDTSVFDTGAPRLVAQLPPGPDEDACAFFFEWRTHFACPTSKPTGLWGLFTGAIVVLLVLLMLYIVLGTLYNRYVLELRGFDQLPQFSAESMRYHVMHAMDLVRSGYEGWQGRGSVSLREHHHDHLNGPAGRTAGPPPGASEFGAGEGNVFVRPGAGPRGAGLGKQKTGPQPEPNPVSHFSQAQQPQAPAPEPSVPPRAKEDVKRSTKEEKAFLLGDDDEEDGNEDITAAATAAAKTSQSQNTAEVAGSAAQGEQGQTAAEMRGRQSGEGEDGKIRL